MIAYYMRGIYLALLLYYSRNKDGKIQDGKIYYITQDGGEKTWKVIT